MVDVSCFDVADIASFLIRFCCCFCCVTFDDKDKNYKHLGGIYCFRILVGLVFISIEFGTENGVFVKEYNQTIPDAFNDGIVSVNTYNSFIVVIIATVALFVAFVVHLFILCNTRGIDSKERNYWLMVIVYKIISFTLDFSMFLFNVFLALSIGDKVVDFSTEGIKTLISLLFFIKLIDMILDLCFIPKDIYAYYKSNSVEEL